MNPKSKDTGKELKKYLLGMENSEIDFLLSRAAKRAADGLVPKIREECRKSEVINHEGVACRNLFDLYCVNFRYRDPLGEFWEELEKIRWLAMDVISRELMQSEIELLWFGNYCGDWYSFYHKRKEDCEVVPEREEMLGNLADDLFMAPLYLKEELAQMFLEGSERNRRLALTMFMKIECVMDEIKMPSFSLAYDMLEAIAIAIGVLDETHIDILQSTGNPEDLIRAEERIAPYIKFIRHVIHGPMEKEAPPEEAFDEAMFYEELKDKLIQILDASFHNYYLYRYAGLTEEEKRPFLAGVKFLYQETLRELQPQLMESNLYEETRLILMTFAEKADCCTHVLAVYFSGLMGRELRIRDETATIFPTMPTGFLEELHRLVRMSAQKAQS